MIKSYLRSVTFLILGLSLTYCSNRQMTCIIKGMVFGRNSDTIIMCKATEDPRFAQIMIPIIDSSFEYKLVIPQKEAYVLIFLDEFQNGVWRPIYIFPENGVINCKLFPMNEFDKNRFKGGSLNKIYNDYLKTFQDTFYSRIEILSDSSMILRKNNQYYSPEYDSLSKALSNAKNDQAIIGTRNKIYELVELGNDKSPKAKAISQQMDQIASEAIKWRHKYIKENPSIVSYYFILEDIKRIKNSKLINVEDIKSNYSELAKKFPDHSYTVLLKEILESYDNIRVGGKFIDFSLPDLSGTQYKLSDIITGKYALIDLWASWCGPCIQTSRSMIPVYEEFKDKGFTICGVAAEIKNTDEMKKRIEKEQFPWINLVELDHKNHIWDKYGRSNAGGGTFLVDNSGIILAIDPTADEVKNILIERLK